MWLTVLRARLAAFLKEHGWVLNLLFIAMGAYCVAGAANAILARELQQLPSVEDASFMSASGSQHGQALTHVHFTATAERNLFGLRREELQAPAAGGAGDDGSGEGGAPGAALGSHFTEQDLKPCTLGFTLRATLVALNHPEWSSAVLVDNTTRETEVFSINEGSNTLGADGTLVAIRSREVVVRRSDHFERCLADGESASSAQVTMAAPGEEGGESGVNRISESQYTIDRKEVDDALSNMNEVMTQARIVPSFKNGKSNGFKLFSIKPGSIYSKIGLQNGDVIQKINGYEMNSPDKALEIYQKLKESDNVAIELQRRGQGMSFNYSIR